MSKKSYCILGCLLALCFAILLPCHDIMAEVKFHEIDGIVSMEAKNAHTPDNIRNEPVYVDVKATGVHKFEVISRSKGFTLDKIVLKLDDRSTPEGRGPAETASTSSGDQLRFIFITCAVNAKFFDPVKKGMNDAADLMGVRCDFIGTEGVDVKAQADMIKRAVEEGYDGIAINIIDPVAFDLHIQEALDQGVPVVGFNVDDHSSPNSRLSSVNQQLYNAGRRLGEYVSPFIPDKSSVLMTMHDKGISALEDRLKGIQDVLKARDIQWDVVISGNESAKGAEVIADYLREHPEMKIVLSTGQSDTEAAGMAIEMYFAGKEYWSAGFDMSSKTLQLIRDGYIRCTVDQQPYIQGFYPVIQLTQYKRYGLMPSDIDAGAAIIDKENVEQVSELVQRGYR